MAKMIVTHDHDYRFPSGSLVALKAGPNPITTKREIVANAVALGFGKAVEDKPATDGK